MPVPLYKPNPSIGEDDGLTVQSITPAFVKMAERAKDYDETGLLALLPALRGHTATLIDELRRFDKKVEELMEQNAKANKKAINRATRPLPVSRRY